MKSIEASEAEAQFSRLLDEVSTGEAITITRDGVPVAELVPPTAARQPDISAVIEEVRAFRQREHITLGGRSLRELIEEGRS